MKSLRNADLANLIRRLQKTTQAVLSVPSLLKNQQRATIALVFETSANREQRQAVSEFMDGLNAVSALSRRTLMQEISHGIKSRVQWSLANLKLTEACAPVEVEVINPVIDGAKASVVLSFAAADRAGFLKCL